MTIEELKLREETKALAREVIAVLDAQQQYFKTRDRADLQRSKLYERSLRIHALKVLAEDKQPTLPLQDAQP